MRFLVDENVPLASTRRLRAAGHDVVAVVEESARISDSEVMARASREQRFVVTSDRDVGELVYRSGGALPAGVVYLRLMPSTPEEPAELLLLALIVTGVELNGRFTVLERHQMRQRPLPERQ